jgi:eukaryotic-like serine/threonine-protein kinase
MIRPDAVRQKRIEDLYHRALTLVPSERTRFVEQACAGDDGLRLEVESLLHEPPQEVPGETRVHGPEPGGEHTPIGQTLGPYRIDEWIGAGGMGNVYRAHDMKLGRDVAMKILPPVFALDAQRLARFRREAHVLASLNHPHVAQIYGFEENNDLHALVLELVGGFTLADRIAGRPWPLEEKLVVARQIAEALESAHEKGIVHRDLKPANIKITPDGRVKVLDFGLAKLVTDEATPPDAQDLSRSPTASALTTREGVVLGTAGYMAPEQVQGLSVDGRADIFAFGCVLYEMLTGRSAFEGENLADILGRVLHRDPDWTHVPPTVPPSITRLLRLCLEKDPRKRRQSAGDVRIDLEQALAAPADGPALGARPRAWLVRGAWIVTMVFAALTAVFAALQFREREPAPRRVQFQIAGPEKSAVQFFQLSPDGRVLALTDRDQRLWIRALDSLQAQPLPGTEGATYPFWSPDSAFLGFFAQGKLKKIAASGGPSQILGDASNPRGATWSSDGTILYAPAPFAGLFQVRASESVPVRIKDPLIGSAATMTPMFPSFLPDGRHFVFVAYGSGADTGIYLGSEDGSPPVRLLPDMSSAVYAPPRAPGGTGHLLFRRGDTLMAEVFDARRLRGSGDVFPVAEHVGISGANEFLGAFTVSQDGTLAYGSGNDSARRLAWIDRTGKPLESLGPAASFLRFRLAPDETRVAYDASDSSGNTDVWLLDSSREVTSRLTFNPAGDGIPTWSPDSLRIVWSSNRGGAYDLYVKSANGTGSEELLIPLGVSAGYATDWSKDGRWLMYQRPGANTGQDLWVASQSGDRAQSPYLQTPFDEQDGRFSPDGRWVAYVSNESGRNEVYVQSFPPSGAKLQISREGGSEPQWRGDGKELFYLAADQKLMATEIELGRSASEPSRAGAPKALATIPPAPFIGLARRSYAASRDGRRFLVFGNTSTDAAPITVVLHWTAGLK